MQQPLPADKVFKLSAHAALEKLQLHWQIKEGYYLYRDRIKLTVANPAQQKIGPYHLPEGLTKHHEILGKFVAYEKNLTLTVPLAHSLPTTLILHYQGCAKSGFCYPPQTRYLTMQAQTVTISDPDANLNATDKVTQLLSSHNLAWILLGFLGFGLLLAFTPCVFPMLPILSGIIVGQRQKLSTQQAFLFSLTYVLSMALTYAAAGVGAAYAGSYIQGALQTPWVIMLFCGVFVALALSLFGFYELQLPAALQQKLVSVSNQQQGGRYVGVAMMGCLSTLIISPCVSPPLISALGYIGQTGNVVLGGSALFCLGLGMGIPLLIVGTSAGKLLPKAGAWLETIKQLFGLALLGVAIWLLARIAPAWLSLVLWVSLLIGSSIYLLFLSPARRHWISRLLSLTLFSLGILFLANPVTEQLSHKHTLNFETINSTTELTKVLAAAQLANKPVILDFYADWCMACKDMEKDVLINASVQAQLQHFIRLRANVTPMDDKQKQLMQNLHVIAPPTFIFFKNGHELKAQRLVGEITADNFSKHLLAITSR